MTGILFSVFLVFGHSDATLLQQDPYNSAPVYVQQTANQSNVYVYGRKTCGNTVRMMEFLKKSKIPYTFYSIDDERVAKRLYSQMKSAGIYSGGSFTLPVVNVNGNLAINPHPEQVRAAYRR